MGLWEWVVGRLVDWGDGAGLTVGVESQVAMAGIEVVGCRLAVEG